jgi:hypothetical protein
VTPNQINVIGAVPDGPDFVQAMVDMAVETEWRNALTHRGLSLVQQPQYRWDNIARAFYTNVVEAATF